MIRLGVVGGFPSEEMLDGSYQLDCIGWIVWIVLAGSYLYQSWVCSEKLSFMIWLV